MSNAAAHSLLDTASKAAIGCIFFAWFFLDTVVVSVGSVKHGVRFVDMAAVMLDPVRLFVPASSSLQRVLFSIVCLACLALSALPGVRRERVAWLGLTAPLLLMLLCGIVLYAKTSGDFFAAGHADPVSQNILRFANGLLKKGSDVVARHIGLDAGGYLAMLAAGWLAWRGLRNFRAAPASVN